MEKVLVHRPNGGCKLCNALHRHVVISDSVGRGGRNIAADVKTIQSALNAVAPTAGGPLQRLAVDGIAGPRTMAAIEKYQRLHIAKPGGRVNPGDPTIRSLNGGLAAPQQAAPAAAPANTTAAQNAAFIARVGGLLPRARRWVQSAQLKIDMASDYVRKGKLKKNDPFPAIHDIGKGEMTLFNKYFHSGKSSHESQLHQLASVRRIFDSMQTVLTGSLIDAPMFGWGLGHFQPDPTNGTDDGGGYDAFTFFGGWHQRRRDGTPRLSADDNYGGRGDLRQDTIFLVVSETMNRTDNYIIGVVVHELAHFVGPGPNSSNRISDYTYETEAKFLTVSNWTALRTAACYAYFAAESALHHVTAPLA